MRMAVINGLLILPIAGSAVAEEALSIPVTPSHERLVIALERGDITVTRGTGDAILMIADCATPSTGPDSDAGSFRSLTSSRTLPDTVVGDDTVAIRTMGNAQRCDVTLSVPAQFELHTRINGAGSIRIDSWRGSVLAWSADGDVSVTNHSGSLSVTAMNGDATVSLSDNGIDTDSAVTAANGVLTVTVRETAVPALRAQARWGDIQTNIDIDFEEIVGAGGNWFVTDRKSDEPLLTLRNLNDNIVIRTVGD